MLARRLFSPFTALLLLSAPFPLGAQLPVADPEVWLRADQGVVSDGSGLIERWEDQSGNNHHFTQATAAKRPRLTAEGFTKGRGELVELEADQNGNSTYGGVLGIDFIVDEEVDITHLAAFDHLRDGIQGTITVKLWSRQDNGTLRTAEDDAEGTVLEQLTFTAAEPGDLTESYRWKTLPAARRLSPGSYTLTASGYTGADAYYSNTNIRGPKVRGISLPPDTRYGGNAGAWPSTVTSYGARYGGSANLRFTQTSGTPTALPAVVFDGTDDGLIAPELLNLVRPSSVFVVYEADRSDFGYVAQNTTGNFTWGLRTDGYYSNGWVRNITPGYGVPRVAGFINNATETRALAGLDDLTITESHTTGHPGRLAIGGGEGRSIDAFPGRIAEVVAFDRQLTPAEIRSLQRYFGDRYGFYTTPAATPQILPPGDLGSGNVTVSLSSDTTGAEIRYTTNGTEPTASSTLYSTPFSVARGTQVKARAFLAGSPSSGVATQYYAPDGGPGAPPAAPTGWFRADLGLVTDAAGGVSQWNDLTGNGNDFFQGAAAARPGVTDFRGNDMAIRTLYGDEGGSTHGGSLGADFEVSQAIEVTHLAAFDHRSDGFASPVTVQLLRRDDRGTPQTPGDDLPGTVLAEIEFTPAAPGTLSGAFRLKSLTSPVTLAPGQYSIQTWGYTGANFYRNSSDATWNSRFLRFVNVSRQSGTPGAWSTTLDSHPVKYNGAGNFRFQPVGGTTPVPAISFDGADDGMVAGTTSNYGRPSTLVFALEYEDDGRFFQNNNVGNWFIRGGDRYSNGYVSNDDLPTGTPLVAVMTHSASGTRFYVNGEDWTDNGALTSPAPGRLAIGGAVGPGNDPAKFRIAELLSYDRELDASERWQVETYLTTRLSLPAAPLPEVAINPPSNFGAGSVDVTLTHPAGPAEIRYTTDGSEPTASSNLYGGSFSVPRDTRVRARAIVSGNAPGPIAEAFYGLTGGEGDLPIAGARLWLRGDRGVSIDDAGGVSQWADLSGQGNHFTQTTKARRPLHLDEPLPRVGRQAIITDDITGGSTWNGSLGDDLIVEQPVELTELGAFDHNKDGFAGTITVEVWSRNNGGTPLTQGDDTAGARLALLTFTSSEPGTLSGNHRFKPLVEPLTLAPGNYTIYAHGYVGTDLYREGNYSRTGADSRFRFVGVSRYSNSPGTWPNSLDSGLLDYTGAANFRYTPLRELPHGVVAFDGLDDGLAGAESMTFGRPSTVMVAFELSNSQFGYLLQNQGGGSWWIRRDGYYANGWVKNENFDFAKVHTATMVQSPTSTRAYRDGADVTDNATLTGMNPGRLSLGGGEGQNHDPIPARVAEVVAFDRALDASELQLMEAYFSRRYRPGELLAQPPSISPPSNYGSGQVTVTLAAGDGATDIHFTTDGSEPTVASPSYTAPFTVPRGTEVKAIASGGGLLPGSAAVAYYGDSAAHPLPVSGVTLWLDASKGVEKDPSGMIRRWRDLSGNGRDVVQPEAVQAPRWVSHGFGGGAREVAPREQGRTGNDTYTGWIGTDFIVNSPVEITDLSVFDSAADGLAGDITVRLHGINDAGTPANAADDTSTGVLTSLTFTAAAPGTLDQGKRRKALPAPLTLNPGRYFIESSGWTGANTYESSENFATALDPALTYPSVSRYGPANAFSGSRVGDNRYLGSAGFVFRAPGNTRPAGPAVRFDGADDGMYGPIDHLVGRPSTVFLVFQRNNGAHGRLLQSGSGENWLLGPQGFYASGWVTQHSIRENVPSLAIAVQDTFESRYFYNGQDLTGDPNPLGNLGRVALGGGEGVYNQPCDGDIAELVIYDRVLTPTERQAVSAALNTRHGLPLEPLQAVAMSPAGGLYDSGRTVTLSHPTVGAVIRYTTDGSDPTASSTAFTTPFLVNTDTVVKARAFADGYAPGVVTDAAFFIDPAATVPPQRSDMLVWLRAGEGAETDESSKVTRWRDLSGKGNHAAQPNAAQRPTLSGTVIGGAPGLVFDGADDFLQLPPGFSNFDNGLTAMIVVRPDVVGSWQRFFDLSRGANYANIFAGRYAANAEFTYDIRGSNGAGNIRATNSLLPLANAIFTVSQSSSGAVKLYQNGSLVAENNSFPRPQNIQRYVNLIGKSAWGSDALYSGTIAEMVIYNSALGDLERETFEQAIRANYGIASTSVGTVAFSPSPATLYPSGVDVTLTTVTPDASIRYTLDGSTPSETSLLYSGPFRLNNSARVRARAFAEGFNASAFSEATYYVGQPPSSGDGLSATYFDEETLSGASFTRVDPAINFNFGGGTPDPAIHPDFFSARWTGKVMPRFSEAYTFYTSQDDGMRVWIDLDRSGTFEDATELLINDWANGGTRERVSSPVNLQAGLLYDIKVEYREYNGHAEARLLWSAFSEPKAIVPQSQLFSNAEFTQTVATPVISPAAGTYNAAVTVTIATATPAATLYYTTDGSEPTTSSQVYTGSFTAPVTTTVRTRAYKAGFNPSGVATSLFTIDAQPPMIQTFTWNGTPISPGETFVATGTIAATATDNQGVTSAEFYYLPAGTTAPILIGSDNSPGNGLSATWNIANVADGAYTVRVRVYDTTGTFSELSRSVNVALAVPGAPSITEPASGTTVETPVTNLRVIAEPNANLRILRDGVFVFSGYANSAGVMLYSAPLPTGTSVFHAVARNRAGNSPASNNVSVTRVREFPALGLSFDSNTVGEAMPVTGTVTLPAPEAAPLTVQITTSIPNRMETVPPVIIPAGATSATFTLVGRVDSVIQLLPTLIVTAKAHEHRDGTAWILLADSPYPVITLEFDSTSVAEDAGSVTGRIRRAVAQNVPLTIHLTNTAPAKVQVPATVTIPGGATSAPFTVLINDNPISDGNVTAQIGAQVRVGDTAVAIAPNIGLEVRDNDGPVLTLVSPRPLLNEGAAVNFALRRQGGNTGSPLTVTLSQSAGANLTLPATANFAAGITEIAVPVQVPVSPTTGTRQVTARAAAAGHVDGLALVTVSDESLADLVPSLVNGPVRVPTEQSFNVNYTIHNFGPVEITNPYLERILLSKDPTPSADDTVVRQVEQTGTVAAGGSYARNLSIFAPREVGDYYLVVVVDPGQSVGEISEANNTAVSALPVEVRAAYAATVQTDASIVPANTPIVFYGSATKEGGIPAAFSMVNIHISSNGTNRVISAVTNSLGNFSTTWRPLQNEGGVYQIGACHPGQPGAAAQDEFEILTMGFDPPPLVRLDEGETVVANAVVRNPNGRDLTGLQITLGTLPAGLTVTPQLPQTTVPTDDQLTVPLVISAAAGFSGSGRFPMTATTTEGVTMTTGLSIRADLLVPVLSIDPASLNASVLRGGTQSVSFTITNTGGLESGPVQVLLPNIPWITLASSGTLPSIPPGQSVAVSLQLAPGADVDLTQFSGNLAVNAQNGGSRAVPFRFRVVSDLTGDLQVKVVDELYYFTEAAPALEGAQVTLRDAISSAIVAQATTAADGTVQFDDVPEAWYRLEISADRHDRYSNNYFLVAGEQSEKLVFISKQLVNYTWTVEEVEIQDVYRITVETTFETNVPAPVVTVTPSRIDVEDLVALGQSKVVNLTVTNEGFIAANEGLLDFSEHPFYEFTPLVKNVGSIPAKSSLVIPVTVRRIGVFDEEGNIVRLPRGVKSPVGAKLVTKSGGSVPCGAGGKFNYSFPCGPENPQKSAPIAVSGVQGNCGGGGGGGGGYIGFHGGYFNTGGGGGGGGGGAGGGGISFASADACDPCVQKAILECLLGFTPLGCPYSAGKCIYERTQAVFGNGSYALSEGTCVEALIGCAADLVPIPGVGAGVNGIFCIKAVAGCGMGSGPGGSGPGGSGPGGDGPGLRNTENPLLFEIGSPWTEALSPEIRSYASEVMPALSRTEAVLDYFAVIFGTRQRVIVLQHEEAQLWGQQFFQRAMRNSEDGMTISPAEINDLAAFASDLETEDQAQLSLVVERWNRTLEYAALGIYEVASVPVGQSIDFIQDSRLKLAAEKLVNAYDTSRELGFSDPLEETGVAVRAFQQTILEGQGGTCSRVKIEISQDLVMTRTAFEATLQLENEREDVGVTDIDFDLQIRDTNGLPSEDLFNIQVTRLTGLGAIDGTGSLDPSTIGSVKWTLIPRDTAALTEPVGYTVGGIIRYTQDGNEFTIPVENVPITVRPDASLALKYFHQRDVFSDDPYTDAIEPAIPYKLAVMVENNGHGPARDLKIISGQPKIVENEKGLFIDFKIIGTEVDGQPLSPSLTAEFGTLGPGDRSIATFLLTSTLQGLFIDYNATFEHVTGLGDPRISLLQSVEIHEMIRAVQAFDAGRNDGSPDFLTNDVPDVNDYPDTIHYSDGGTDLVTVKQSGTFTGTLSPTNLSLTLDVGAFTGWSYLRVPDPAQGSYRLVSVQRADGRMLPIDVNAWQTDRTFIGAGRRPVYEHILHLADSNSSGSYTLNYEPVAAADSTPPVSAVQALPAQSPADIPVFWSGTDNQAIAYYDVYVSSNGGAFSLWRSRTAEAGGIYPGTPGETYAFYSVATDFAGNRETKSAAAEATTTAVNANQPPVIAEIPNQSIDERSLFTYQASATDPDGANSLIRWSLGSSVPGVTIDPVSGMIRWNTGESDGGRSVSLIVVATDAGSPPAVANEPFTITVNDVNSPPTITPVGPQTLQSGGMLIVDVDAADGDSPTQSLTYALANGPAGAAIHPTTGVVTWVSATTTTEQTHLFQVVVTDSGSVPRSTEMSFAATVQPVVVTDTPPVFTSVPVVLWVKGTTYQLDVIASDADGDPISLSASLTGTPGASFSDLGGGTGRFSWNTAPVDEGTYQVPLTATANGKAANATLRVRVADNELYWNWVEGTFGDLPADFDLALLEKAADPDGDERSNVHEMAFLTNPLAPDSVPVKLQVTRQAPFTTTTLSVHRRVGAENYVEFHPRRSDFLSAWQRIPITEYSAALDAAGDDDNRAESQRVDFQIFEYFPTALPKSRFYDIESVEKP